MSNLLFDPHSSTADYEPVDKRRRSVGASEEDEGVLSEASSPKVRRAAKSPPCKHRSADKLDFVEPSSKPGARNLLASSSFLLRDLLRALDGATRSTAASLV